MLTYLCACMRAVRARGREEGNDRGVSNIRTPEDISEECSEPGGTVLLRKPSDRVCKAGRRSQTEPEAWI